MVYYTICFKVVNIFIEPSMMANLGLDVNSIIGVMQAQNLLVATGEMDAGEFQIKLIADGTYSSLQDIRDQIIISRDGREVRIGDIATVERGYINPPSTLMRVNGKWAIGIGVATGENRAKEAAKLAISSKLLETSIQGAKGLLFNITGSMSMSMMEINEASEFISSVADPDAVIIMGAGFSDEIGEDEIRVTIIATGFDGKKKGVVFPNNTWNTTADAVTNPVPSPMPNPMAEGDLFEAPDFDDVEIPAFMRRK